MDATETCENNGKQIKHDIKEHSLSNENLPKSDIVGDENFDEGKLEEEYLLGSDVDEACNNGTDNLNGNIDKLENILLKSDENNLPLQEELMECNEDSDLLDEDGTNKENDFSNSSKSTKPNSQVVTETEDQLLSDISMMVDGAVDNKQDTSANSPSKDLEPPNDAVEGNDDEFDGMDEDNFLGDTSAATSSTDIKDSDGKESMIPSKETQREKSIGVKENNQPEKGFLTSGTIIEPKGLVKSESAFKRLASLGVIEDEKPVIETKENVLMKLASRGAISITPASGSALPSSVTSSISITPTKPTMTTKQKPKKIKIDPGKSLDIDKDFNSLINILSRASDEPSLTSPNKKSDQKKSTKTVVDMPTVSKQTVKIVEEESIKNDDSNSSNSDMNNKRKTNEIADQNLQDCPLNKMEVGPSEDPSSIHEMDYTESHDDSKSVSHSSGHTEDNEEKETASNRQKNVIEEGSAEILIFGNNVFYNQVQEFNRDISIAALTVFSEMHQQDPRTRNRGMKRKAGGNGENCEIDTINDEHSSFEPGKKSENGITILEALSATGLRSIRYAREIPGLKQVIANDLNPVAVECIEKNIEHNGVQDLVTATQSDAALLMYQKQAAQEWYDAIDLDPYGGPAPFLDSAVKGVRDGGLLLVTCTDMAILAGNSPETCYARYGAISLRGSACHEMAIRIILQCIESHANRHGRYIVPLLSFHVDFYLRVIVQLYTSPVTCKKTTSKLSLVYQCCGCSTFTLHPLGNVTSSGGPTSQPKFSLEQGPPVNSTCFHCYHKHYVGGPIWSAPIYSPKFVERMLTVVENGRFATSKRMQGMLEVIREELPDVPLHYSISGLCTKLHCQAIPLIDIRSAILNAGYRVSSSHTSPTSIKTNAPNKVVWDIMRCWVHMNPVNQKRLTAGSVAAAIILEPPIHIANFDIHPRARPSSSMRKLLRYQQNPQKNWGPGTRSRLNTTDCVNEDKRKANQNKNKNKKNIDIIEVVTIDDEDETTEEAATPASVQSTSEPIPTTSTSST